MNKLPGIDSVNEWKYRLFDNSAQFGFWGLSFKPIWGVVLILLMFLAVLYTIVPSFVLVVLALTAAFLVFNLAKKIWRNHKYHEDYVKPTRKNEEHVVETTLADRPYYKK